MTAIYQEHFGLSRPPFQITPNTDYFFSGNRRGDLLTALLHVAAHDEGIVTVVAEVGSGKTLLARQLITRLPNGISTVYLANPSFSRDEILSAIGRDLGLTGLPPSIEEKLATLQNELLRRHANGERVLLVIDEAHTMPAESLEEIRLLSNLETGSHKLVNILLLGQPELDSLLAEPRLRQVHDRVIHRFELTPFSRDDGAAYIDHRLRIAGWTGGRIFTPTAIAQLIKSAGGRARRINLLADKAMLAAYAENLKKIDKRHIRLVQKEFAANDPARPGKPVSHTAVRWLPLLLTSLALSILIVTILFFSSGFCLQLQPPVTPLAAAPLAAAADPTSPPAGSQPAP